MSLVTGDIIFLIGKSQESTGWDLWFMNKFRKLAGYQINNQKKILFLYINIEQSQRDLAEQIHL